MKTIVFLLLTAFITTANAQIKFAGKIMDNGLRYPVALLPANKAAEDSINKAIDASLSDLVNSDFCVGDFGYVQKGNHVQIHMLCNCIDMDQSEHRYLFFNIETGALVPVSDMFSAEESENALKFISDKVREYHSSNSGCENAFSKLDDSISFSKLNIRLAADGIEVRPVNTEVCEKFALKIAWSEIQKFLRYQFI